MVKQESMSSGGGTRPRSRPSDKVAKQRNPSGKSSSADPEVAVFKHLEPDTDEKEMDKIFVAEDPDEDYEADNYEEEEESDDERKKKEIKAAARVLTRVTDNKQMAVEEMRSADEESNS